jgi:methylmalonyl-CoA mutase N-terminal domain/subunit
VSDYVAAKEAIKAGGSGPTARRAIRRDRLLERVGGRAVAGDATDVNGEVRPAGLLGLSLGSCPQGKMSWRNRCWPEENLMARLSDAARADATEGEIVHALRGVFADYSETPTF